MERIKVLHIKKQLSSDGATAILFNMAKELKEKVRFDFLLHAEEENDWVWKFEALGSEIFYITETSAGRLKKERARVRFLNEFLKEHQYDRIHIDTDSHGRVEELFCAWRCGVKKRIYHSHNSRSESRGFLSGFPGYKKIARYFIAKLSTDMLACSTEAAEWMFPRRFLEDVKIIKNGIDTEQFRYNPDARERIRRQLGLEQCFAIGCVARFAQQKNHTFLLDIFAEVQRKDPEARLLLIGEGERKAEIQKKAQDLGLEEKINFIGNTDQVEAYMSAMDIYAMPSLFEGLSVVFVEAQTSGLYCIAPTSISPETKVCERMEFISLSEGTACWAERILSNTAKVTASIRAEAYRDVVDAGYDIRDASRQLLAIYQSQ